ncbi:uncharacterized protein [Drosophila virilis]|uniref:Uncharacterized protein, isoform B n=2 Tax=Drosophila virilis TaxID=7244 RepID=A0A0Q9W7G9_DROVI|nr:mediator of RNA polymerase II transcription subunit 15 isoform X1 [Drosophila virilis]KRF80809.1 uncharacterized protein Dvir_GJ17039, isoform B [Drosophila virilis]
MADNPNMANRNKSLPLKKFKRVASKALRMERERSELELQMLNAAKPNKVLRDPEPEIKPVPPQEPSTLMPPLSPKRQTQVNMRPSSQPPISRKEQSTTLVSSAPGLSKERRQQDDNVLASREPDDNITPRRKPDDKMQPSLLPEQTKQRRRSPDSMQQRQFQDEHVHQRRPKDDYINQRRPKDSDDLQHRRQVKQMHEHAHQHVRVATAAAAAAAATVVAQLRKDAIDAVARQQAPYMRMAALSSARSNSSNGSTSDQRRVIRNSNLLSSALSIIREMDPAFLETLCYAIHDQVTKDDPSESE